MSYSSRHHCVLVSIALAGLAGCIDPKDGPPARTPPRGTGEIVDTINANNARLEQPLYGPVSVSSQFLDSKKSKKRYDLSGRLAMQRPRNLWLRLDHSLDSDQVEVGSNQNEYWLKIRPEVATLWWGFHRHVGKPCVESVSVDPRRIADAVGLEPLKLEGPYGLRRITERRIERLIYPRIDLMEGRQTDREYWIDRDPPFMVQRVIYRDPAGQEAMTVTLDKYMPVGAGGPLLARHVEVKWPKRDSWMKIDVADVQFRDVNPQTFVRPTEPPDGIREIVQLDAACD